MVTQEKLDEVQARHPGAGDINKQLHAVLTSLITMDTTAFDIVENTKRNQGLDAWRKLNRKYDPNKPVSNLRLMQKISRPLQVGTDQLLSAIEPR